MLDAVIDVGNAYGLRPFGDQALSMARIEAGLALINVEFSSSRLAYNDDQRVTPSELGFGWMLRGIDDERTFIGRDAIRRELAEKSSRWSTVGLIVDWRDYNQLYNDAGLIPPMDEVPGLYDSMLYDDDGGRIGYATNIMYSPMLQSHIAMARVRPDLSAVGSRVNLELTVNHAYRTVPADVTRLPFFNPPRKTA
jgi:aminomethyltransferase